MLTISDRKKSASSKRKSAPSKSKGKASANNARKGKLVEAIVALMHDYPGVKVERNVFLPPVHSNEPRRREIDVLLTSYVSGYPVRIAFQCKNERKKIEPGLIDAFIGELDDVGIPPQQGIFVCINGYTAGDLDRARIKGIRTLVLNGLTKDRLASEVGEAFQFNVYLLAEVTQMTIRSNVSMAEHEGQFLVFCDDEKNVCGSIPDLIYARWQQGDPPSILGEYHLDLDVPQGWNQFIRGKNEPVLGISATVRVRGHIISLSGKATRHALVDASKEIVDRTHLDVQFDLPRKGKVTLPVTTVSTEEELKAFTNKPASVKVMSRIRLPRILCGACYHPLSERVARLTLDHYKKLQSNEVEELEPLTLAGTEGTDLSAVLESPWQGLFKGGLPILATDAEGNTVDVRLLMDAGEYRRVIELRPQFDRHPTPELACCLYWAYLMIGEDLIQKGVNKSASGERLIEQAIESIKQAIEVDSLIPRQLAAGSPNRN